MNNKIVWVFGPSAVGKETFIKYIASNEQAELLLRLGWGNRKIVICEESINWVVQEDDDGNELLRKNLDRVIQEYSKNNSNSIILIKGQDLDLDNNTLNIVKKSLVKDDHEIIFLYVDFDILYQRYMKKKWWDETMTKDVCKNWAQKQVDLLIYYQSAGFKIKALDSADDKYLGINFPERL